MTVLKRESRLRRWAKKLNSCFRSHYPHGKYKSGYVEKHYAPPPQRGGPLIGRREQPVSSPKRALPTAGRRLPTTPPNAPVDETIRFVTASANSLVVGRSYRPSWEANQSPLAHRNERTSHRSYQQIEPSPWKLSLRSSREFLRRMPVPVFDTTQQPKQPRPEFRAGSMDQLPADPFQVRPLQIVRKSVHTLPVLPSEKPTLSSRRSELPEGLQQSGSPAKLQTTTPSLSSPSKQATSPRSTTFENIHGWEHDWDKPLQHRIGGNKGIWRSASDRLFIRNKDSIQRLTEEKRRKEMKERMEIEKREAPQMRSIKSIEEMAEEDRRAVEEWGGIAAQLAADSQNSGIQEVHSFSYRHQRRSLASGPCGGGC